MPADQPGGHQRLRVASPHCLPSRGVVPAGGAGERWRRAVPTLNMTRLKPSLWLLANSMAHAPPQHAVATSTMSPDVHASSAQHTTARLDEAWYRDRTSLKFRTCMPPQRGRAGERGEREETGGGQAKAPGRKRGGR